MQATEEQLEMLDKLQEIDRKRLQAERALRQLPYRDQVLEARKRKADVQAKLQKVEELHAKESRKMQRSETEDRQLAEKQQKTQEKIETASGDYRAVNTWTRDLEVMNKRRAFLEGELTASLAKLEEIEGVRNRAKIAVSQLEEQEKQLVQRYRMESERLTSEIEKCQAIGKVIASKLPKNVLEAYVSSVKRCGGIGLAHLLDSNCSVCRGNLDANRLLQIRKDAPLAECPLCHRLLVVE